jgi:ABC-type molybdate transport system substrate-binding protein
MSGRWPGAIAGVALVAAAFGWRATIALHAQRTAEDLHVCHAGSLTAAFAAMETDFKAAHPSVAITDVAGGSVDLARRLAAGEVECDVYAPADHVLIDMLLEPSRLADFSIVFARGRMVLAWSAADPKAQPVTVAGQFAPPSSVPQLTGAWYSAVTAPGVRIAGAHPFLDPGGYRAHMIFDLAQAHYQKAGLYNSLLRHYVVNPADGDSVPVLGKDFEFQLTYEHTAAAAAKRDPSYRYATLPEEIDLSSEHRYASSVTIPGLGIPASPASVTVPATTVEWGVTITSNSRHRDGGTAFIAALLGPSGRQALLRQGPTPLGKARVSRKDLSRVPQVLQALISIE